MFHVSLELSQIGLRSFMVRVRATNFRSVSSSSKRSIQLSVNASLSWHIVARATAFEKVACARERGNMPIDDSMSPWASISPRIIDGHLSSCLEYL
ncbi:hypothetical protein D3C84_897810 [compost metagenome]